MKLLILTLREHVPPVNVGIPYNKGGGAITRSDRAEPFNTRATVHHRHGPVGPTPKYGRVILR